MVKYSKDDFIDVDRYDREINRLGYLLYARERAENSLGYMNATATTYFNRALYEMKLTSGGQYFSLQKDSVIDYLIRCMGCPEHYFHNRKSETGNLSLDKNKVLSKLISNGYAKEFLSLYSEHRSALSRYNTFKGVVSGCTEVVAKSRDGEDLVKIPFNCNVQKNLRFNYNNHDIISQIPKEVVNTIGVEDGYFLAWGDFAQSDFRIAYNLFIRNEENDKIMNKFSDKYEALARIVYKTLGMEFDLEQFKEQRKQYKVLTLATMYGTRNSQVAEEQKFISTFSAFLNKCPRYKEYYDRLQERLQMKSAFDVKSYFGHDETIYYNSWSAQSTVYDALNSPIQTGTSEVVIHTVLSILDKARELGLSEDQFSLYFTRHDEPVFRIREDAMDAVWILKEHSEVLVDNWSPLAMDFDFGYFYKTPDENLQKKAEECYKRHAMDITQYTVEPNGDTEYYPIKPMLNLCAHWVKVGDGTSVLTVQKYGGGETIFILLDTDEDEQIISELRVRVKDCIEKIQSVYQDVCIHNNYHSGRDFFNETSVLYLREANSFMTPVVKMCESIVTMQCGKLGISCPVNAQPLTEFPPPLKELYLDKND